MLVHILTPSWSLIIHKLWNECVTWPAHRHAKLYRVSWYTTTNILYVIVTWIVYMYRNGKILQVNGMIPKNVDVARSELSCSSGVQQIVRSGRVMADESLGGGRVSGKGRGGWHSGYCFPQSHFLLLGPLLQTTLGLPHVVNHRRLQCCL